MKTLAVTAAIALGLAAAAVGFAVFFLTPYSQLFPVVLLPSGLLGLGAFIASFATRSFVAGGFALVPALILPLVMSVSLLAGGRSVSGWPAIAAGACVVALVASWLGSLLSQDRVIKGGTGET